MLFDLFLIAKVSIKIEYPNKFLLFIENLCYCSLKISGASKNCRLKITAESKNYYLKIPVRVRVYARVCMRVHMIVRTPRATRHTTGTRPPEHDPDTTGHHRTRNTAGHHRTPPDTTGKERDTDNTEKPAYIGKIADDKKSIKKVKKNL